MIHKKLIYLLFILLVIFTACQTTGKNEKSDTDSWKDPLGAHKKPDLTKAYFYGEFGDKYNKLVDQAILFKNHDLDKTINFKIKPGSEFRLYEVDPGTYSNDFGYYLWDVFYWNQNGIYQVKPGFKQKFTVKAGEIYYIGSFNSIGFTFDHEKHIESLLKTFIYFRDLPIHSGYNQKVKG